MTTEDVRNGFRVHAALSQLHRWYLYYEEPGYGIDNQLDILSEDIEVASGLGVARGHTQYAERVAQLPSTWQNAHEIQSTSVAVADDGSISLLANITYLNTGILEDGGIRSAQLEYTTKLVPTDTLLPVFTSIEITQISEGVAEAFVSAYGTNRMRSLVHYWLALIEDPSRNAAPVKEILADQFRLNFSSGVISDFEGFEAWLAGPGSSVAASTQEIGEFTYQTLDENEYIVSMVFDWIGILPDGAELAAKTKHTWRVLDNPSERFARIKQVDVAVLEPFAPRE